MADTAYRDVPRSFSEINEELKREEEEKAAKMKEFMKSLGKEGKSLFSSLTSMFGKDDDGKENTSLLGKIADFVGSLDENETKAMSTKAAALVAGAGVAGTAVTAAVGVANAKSDKSNEKSAEASTTEASEKSSGNPKYIPSEETMANMDEKATQVYESGRVVKRMSLTPEMTASMSDTELSAAASHGFVSPEDSTAITRLNGEKTAVPFIKKDLEPASKTIEMAEDGFFDSADISKLAPDTDKAHAILESSKIASPVASPVVQAASIINNIAQELKSNTAEEDKHNKEAVTGAFNNANSSRVAAAEALQSETVRNQPSLSEDGPSFNSGF